MSKALFRFLRGELNGYYVTQINALMNKTTESIKKLLVDTKRMQFNLQTMPAQTLYDIGTFAGVYLLRLSAGEAYGAMRMTESHIVNEQERSERGLLERSTEQFTFEHTEQDSYDTDINTLATSNKRSGLTGDEEVQGYISSESSNVIDENGNVNPDVVLSVPPADVAYSEFYGNQFMFLSEQTQLLKEINPVLFIELYKVMQYIRYNGVNIKSFAQMVSIVCPDGLVKIQSITKREGQAVFEVTYSYDGSVEIDVPQQRLSMLEYLTLLKFPQFMLIAL